MYHVLVGHDLDYGHGCCQMLPCWTCSFCALQRLRQDCVCLRLRSMVGRRQRWLAVAVHLGAILSYPNRQIAPMWVLDRKLCDWLRWLVSTYQKPDLQVDHSVAGGMGDTQSLGLRCRVNWSGSEGMRWIVDAILRQPVFERHWI